jgi:hypothetical protein
MHDYDGGKESAGISRDCEKSWQSTSADNSLGADIRHFAFPLMDFVKLSLANGEARA